MRKPIWLILCPNVGLMVALQSRIYFSRRFTNNCTEVIDLIFDRAAIPLDSCDRCVFGKSLQCSSNMCFKMNTITRMQILFISFQHLFFCNTIISIRVHRSRYLRDRTQCPYSDGHHMVSNNKDKSDCAFFCVHSYYLAIHSFIFSFFYFCDFDCIAVYFGFYNYIFNLIFNFNFGIHHFDCRRWHESMLDVTSI